MPISILRLDMRSPDHSPAQTQKLYEAGIEMARWADEHGFLAITLSEHHGTEDGYLPSPLPLAGCIAGATKQARIQIGALLATLYDPIKLAEDLVVLDHASGGRVAIVAGMGYRPEEYEIFGRDFARRGKLLDECLEVLLKAWTGEPFEYQGRTVRVTPRPFTEPHPPVFVGGQSRAAARRAARFALPFQPASNDPEMLALYLSECERLAVEDPVVMAPGAGEMVFVTRDPDRTWEQVGPHWLHEAMIYASWQPSYQRSTVHSDARTLDDLRREGKFLALTPQQCLERARTQGPAASFVHYPLCAGTPPELGWESLRLYGDEVLPKLA